MANPTFLQKQALHLLRNIKYGSLELITPEDQVINIGADTSPNSNHDNERLPASLKLLDWSALSDALKRGDIGFGEGFISGKWTTNDLTSLLLILSKNRRHISQTIYGNKLRLVLDRLLHWKRRNTKNNAEKNILAHYDLGNDFYELWLDDTMTYSSALFRSHSSDDAHRSLVDAQILKIDTAIEKLGELQRDSVTLEIGCGWGMMAVRRLEKQPGQHVGLTLSPSQQIWAKNLLLTNKLVDRCDIRIEDYRDIRGRYDGILSIEMIEAVGQKYWPTFFQKIHNCLKPGAKAVLQAITIDDQLFDRYSKGTDFIQRYIFPGGMLPSLNEIEKHAEKTNLQVESRFSFGMDYADTLKEWRNRFESKEAEIQRLGFSDEFQRMWRFYLAYCEAGFRSGDLNVSQFTLVAN